MWSTIDSLSECIFWAQFTRHLGMLYDTVRKKGKNQCSANNTIQLQILLIKCKNLVILDFLSTKFLWFIFKRSYVQRNNKSLTYSQKSFLCIWFFFVSFIYLIYTSIPKLNSFGFSEKKKTKRKKIQQFFFLLSSKHILFSSLNVEFFFSKLLV